MRAMILAAGFGTRLRPLTERIPKPLVPVVGKPNIVRTVEHLRRFGITEIAVNLHHLPEAIRALLGDGSSLGVHIAYSHEPRILGTGGGIKKALPLLGDETFVVVNGDALFAPDLAAALRVHRRSGALATLVVRQDPGAEAFGAVGIDDEGRIRRLVWAGDPAAASRHLMFTGVHLLEPEIAARLPDEGCIVRQTYAPLVGDRAPLFGAVDDGYFCDLGTPERYLEANLALVTGRERLPGLEPPSDGVYLGSEVQVGDGCRIGPGVVIGDRARLAPGIRVARAVVLETAEVTSDTYGAIVAPGGLSITT
jgi:NDP-sugar pyrophosphorylase family protein